MQYFEQIKHPLWQKKRLEVLESKSFTCENCADKDSELHVHHPYYRRGAMIWDYDANELQCLCGQCHKDAHAIDEKLKQHIALLAPLHKIQLLGYIDSMIGPELHSDDPDYIHGYDDRIEGIMRQAGIA